MQSQIDDPDNQIIPEESYNEMRKKIFAIAWPVLLELVLASLFGMVDMMIVGNYNNQQYSAAAGVAAIGMINQPILISLALIQALGVGGTALISRYYGAKKLDRLETVAKHVLVLSFFFVAIPLAVILFVFQEEILVTLGAEPDALMVGLTYFKWVIIGFLFLSITLSLSANLRGIGETRIPMKVNIVANGMNMILSLLLVNGYSIFPEMGVSGAGFATMLSNVISAALVFIYVSLGKSKLPFNPFEPFRFNRHIMRRVVQVGLPSAGEQLILRLGIILYLRMVAGLGTVVLAAHQISLNITSLTFTPGAALGIASSALVGQALGAERANQAERYARYTSKVAMAIGLFMGLLFFFLGEQIGALYSSDEAIIKNVGMVMAIIAVIQPFQCSQLTTAGALRGAGDTIFPMISVLICILGVRVLTAYVLIYKFNLGLAGAWYAVLADQLIRSIMIRWRFNSGVWKNIVLS